MMKFLKRHYVIIMFVITGLMVAYAIPQMTPDTTDVADRYLLEKYWKIHPIERDTVDYTQWWTVLMDTTVEKWWEIASFKPSYNIQIMSPDNERSLIIDFSSDTLRVYGDFQADSAAQVFIDELISEYDATIYNLKQELENCRESNKVK